MASMAYSKRAAPATTVKRATPASYGPPEIRPEEVKTFSVLGDGSFGTVYKGTCRSKDVAVKVLHNQDLDEKTLTAFRKEVQIMSQIFHPNIVLFLGACTVPGNLMIVTELMPKGDLETMLQKHTIQMSLYMRMKMALDAALGMTWLHESNPQIIHRDLKTSNLLVDENHRIKICDFGLSQIKRRGETLFDGQDGAKGTPLWMAPEVMMGQEFNEKADVYSFGIVLWEILTRKEPFEEFESYEEFRAAVCFRNVRPAIPADSPRALRELIEACWNKDPHLRPSFSQIVRALYYIIIDCTVSDEVGNQFWKNYFLKEDVVPWNDFLSSFFDMLKAYNYGTPLPAHPTDEQLRSATEQQRHEFGQRSTDNYKRVQLLSDDMDTTDTPADSYEVNTRILRELIAEKPRQHEGGSEDEYVHVDKFGSTLAWFGPIVDGTEVVLFRNLRRLLSQPWFHGDIDTNEAENRLRSASVGTFLVRFSSHVGSYTISRASDGRVTHQRIPKKGGYFIILNRNFRALDELISQCSKELGLDKSCQGSRYQKLFEDKTSAASAYIQISTD